MSFSSVWTKSTCPQNIRNIKPRYPNSYEIHVTGYLYGSVPIFFDLYGRTLTPIQSIQDSESLTYRFIFSKWSNRLSPILMRTSEDVYPVVYVVFNNLKRKVFVSRFSKINSKYIWEIIF